jgi:hypothetical protein
VTTTLDAPLDFERAERSAKAEVDRLESVVAAEALESLDGDKAALAELAEAEQELGDAKRAIVRLRMAQVEQGRRNAKAREETAAAGRAEAYSRARVLQGQRQEAARKVDAALAEFAKQLCAWDKLSSAQEAALRQAGQDGNPARARAWQPSCAALYALRAAGCPHGILTLEPPPAVQWVRPLVENDFRGLEPLTAKET